jgi:hypothetical protein
VIDVLVLRLLLSLTAIGAAAAIVSGCATSTGTSPYSFGDVRSDFVAHGLKVTSSFNAAKVSQATIDRLAPSTNPDPLQRRLAAVNRIFLEQLRAAQTSMLSFASGSPDGDITVAVSHDPTGAARVERNVRSVQARQHARFEEEVRKPHTTGEWIPLVIERRENVVSLYPGTVKSDVQKHVRAALAAL